MVGCIRNVDRTVLLLVDTVELVKDTVMAVDVADKPEVDINSDLEHERERDSWTDTGLMLEECREVDSRYIRLCFPCFAL